MTASTPEKKELAGLHAVPIRDAGRETQRGVGQAEPGFGERQACARARPARDAGGACLRAFRNDRVGRDVARPPQILQQRRPDERLQQKRAHLAAIRGRAPCTSLRACARTDFPGQAPPARVRMTLAEARAPARKLVHGALPRIAAR